MEFASGFLVVTALPSNSRVDLVKRRSRQFHSHSPISEQRSAPCADGPRSREPFFADVLNAQGSNGGSSYLILASAICGRYHPSVFRLGTAAKCASLVATGKSCCLAIAAI